MDTHAIASKVLRTLLDALRDAARPMVEPGYLDAIESAHYIGFEQRRFEDKAAKEIPCHRLSPGGKRLFRKTDLDRFMEAHREEVAE
jgi:hypothetical protein